MKRAGENMHNEATPVYRGMRQVDDDTISNLDGT